MIEKYGFLLVTDEKWWNRLCNENVKGKKVHAFVRRSIVGPKEAKLLLFYVKYPAKEVRGIGEFIERITGNIEILWNNYGAETCLQSYAEYIEFMKGRNKATFIRFKNLKTLSSPIPLERLSEKTNIARLPRSGKYLSQEIVNQLI
jgi:predicted transcriptional regulator